MRRLGVLWLIGAVAFLALADGIGGERPLLPGDAGAAELAEDVRTEAGDNVVARLTDVGSLPAVALLTLLSARRAARRSRALAVALVAGLLLTSLAVAAAKAVEARPRPPGGLVEVRNLAYPSGHAACATAFVACAVVILPAGATVALRIAAIGGALGLALLVGWSRIYLRVHYLSDVLGGFALATAAFGLCAMLGLHVDPVRHNGRR